MDSKKQEELEQIKERSDKTHELIVAKCNEILLMCQMPLRPTK